MEFLLVLRGRMKQSLEGKLGGNTLEMRLWGCHRYSTIKVEETGELYLGTGDRGGVLQLAYLLSWQESQSFSL